MYYTSRACPIPALRVNLGVIGAYSVEWQAMRKRLDAFAVHTCIVRDGDFLLVHPHAPATAIPDVRGGRRTSSVRPPANSLLRYDVTLSNYIRNITALRNRLARCS